MLYKEAKAHEAIKLASIVRQFISIQLEAMDLPIGGDSDLWDGLLSSNPSKLEYGLKELDNLGAPQKEIDRLKELFVWIAESFPTKFPSSHQFLNKSHIKPYLALGYSIDDINRLDEALTLTLFIRICFDLPEISSETQWEIHGLLLEDKMDELYNKLGKVASGWTPQEIIEVTQKVPEWKSDLSYRGYVYSHKRAFTEGFCTGGDGLPLLFDVETGLPRGSSRTSLAS